MLLVANLSITKRHKKTGKMSETLANGYSSESIWRELSNEYQIDKVQVFFKDRCVLVLWTNVASALERSRRNINLRWRLRLDRH